MNRQDAIQTLSAHLAHWERLRTENIAPMPEGERTIKALGMAIEALSQPIVAKHFDIQSGYIYCSPQIAENVKVVVRCKDCRYRELDGETTHFYWCRINERPVDDDDFCAWGERKGGEDE